MTVRSAIGIDPDSKNLVCSLVSPEDYSGSSKTFSLAKMGLDNFIKWIKKQGDIIIAIEGSNGQSRPIEKALRKNNIIFYSFKPGDVKKFRESILGWNKDNERDAEAVSRYAMSLEMQGRLNNYKRVWDPNIELQMFTRKLERLSQEITRERNNLWKYLKELSQDLYLALGGSHPDIEIKNNILDQKGVLSLLFQKSDISEWKNMSKDDFFVAMGGRNYKGRQELIQALKQLALLFNQKNNLISLLVKDSAETILFLKNQKNGIEKSLATMTKDNIAVNKLKEIKGVGLNTASVLVAEIIDIRRFISNNKLAGYSGFGRTLDSSGDEGKGDLKKSKRTLSYNRRLKNAFMTVAKNYIQYNPNSHLAGWFKNLVKNGMKVNEARKRIARALIRVIYRQLKDLTISKIEINKNDDVASDKNHHDHKDHISNTSSKSTQKTISISSIRNKKSKDKQKEILKC